MAGSIATHGNYPIGEGIKGVPCPSRQLVGRGTWLERLSHYHIRQMSVGKTLFMDIKFIDWNRKGAGGGNADHSSNIFMQ